MDVLRINGNGCLQENALMCITPLSIKGAFLIQLKVLRMTRNIGLCNVNKKKLCLGFVSMADLARALSY